jgi:hypothetical protein
MAAAGPFSSSAPSFFLPATYFIDYDLYLQLKFS